MTAVEPDRDSGGIPPALAGALALGAGVGGGLLLGRGEGTTGLTGGILLLVAGLGFLAVAVGQGPYGPETEGRLDLSTRLATGLLGGALGGMAHLLTGVVVDGIGLAGLLGVDFPARLSGGALGGHAVSGALWGLLLAVLYRRIPGRGPRARGLLFSLVPALWVLLKVFPRDLEVGLFGVELGALTFVFVLLVHAVWGLVVGSVLRWARDTEFGPVSRPLGA